MAKQKIKSDGRTITVRVPISIRKRGGKKVVLTPDGSRREASEIRSRQHDNAVIKALARGFRWREMLENGTFATINELAAAEQIAETYVGRVVRLTLLAPDLVEQIIAGNQPPNARLPELMRSFPIEWERQRKSLGTIVSG